MAGTHNFTNRIQERRNSAKERQEASDKLTLEQKIARSKPKSKEHVKYTYALGLRKQPIGKVNS